MTYLLRHATRHPALRLMRRGVRLDLQTLLNRPGYFAGAHIRAFVEDTSERTLRLGRGVPTPRIELEITDCVNEIHLEFNLNTAGHRENALHKVDTLLGALAAFREAVAAEAALHAQREDVLRRRRFRECPARN
jgi:hypothetical protein